MAVISVVYPNRPGAKFDFDYYTSRHVPLIGERWGTMGLTGAQVLKGVASPDGGAPGHLLTAMLTFESLEALQSAVAAHGAEIIGDIANFTDLQPNIQIDEKMA